MLDKLKKLKKNKVKVETEVASPENTPVVEDSEKNKFEDTLRDEKNPQVFVSHPDR